MILMIDNYDSFVYNIYQYVGELYGEIEIRRNDEISIEDIEKMSPQGIIISPGPGRPSEAGISEEVIRRFAGEIPILGVYLGHQAIGEVFGGKVIHALEPMHGKQSSIFINTKSPLFEGLPEKIEVGRYHSLVVEESSLPECLDIIGFTSEGEIMALKHKEYNVYGVQFHPESLLTQYGKWIVKNFLSRVIGLTVYPIEEITLPKKTNVLKPYLRKIMDKEDLNREEAEEAMNNIMEGAATDAQIGSFLTALRMKGETIEEITGFAKIMRCKARAIAHKTEVIDIVGTGGDLSGTFNISTTTAFVVAGAGVNVAKHGNRSVSSKCGSADVLEALGIKIDISPEEAERCLDEIGICFMFAPCFHHAMRFAAPSRKEIGVRSVFNILGPLSNPAYAEYILLGVYEESLLEVMGTVLMNLGTKKAVVVYGIDGLDEVSLSNATKICEVEGAKLIKYEIKPEKFGLERTRLEEVKGGGAKENAQITLDILQSKIGPKRDIVILNAAVALYGANKVSSIEGGIKMATASIDSGSALKKLQELKSFFQRGDNK